MPAPYAPPPSSNFDQTLGIAIRADRELLIVIAMGRDGPKVTMQRLQRWYWTGAAIACAAERRFHAFFRLCHDRNNNDNHSLLPGPERLKFSWLVRQENLSTKDLSNSHTSLLLGLYH